MHWQWFRMTRVMTSLASLTVKTKLHIISYCDALFSTHDNGLAVVNRLWNIMWRRMVRPLHLSMIQDICRQAREEGCPRVLLSVNLQPDSVMPVCVEWCFALCWYAAGFGHASDAMIYSCCMVPSANSWWFFTSCVHRVFRLGGTWFFYFMCCAVFETLAGSTTVWAIVLHGALAARKLFFLVFVCCHSCSLLLCYVFSNFFSASLLFITKWFWCFPYYIVSSSSSHSLFFRKLFFRHLLILCMVFFLSSVLFISFWYCTLISFIPGGGRWGQRLLRALRGGRGSSGSGVS